MAERALPRLKRRRVRSFSGGDVLGRTFSIWARNIVAFSLLSMVAYSPLLLFFWLVIQGHIRFETVGGLQLVLSVLILVLGLWLTGALAYGVVRQLQKQPATFGSAVGVGISRMLPVIGTTLCILACFSLAVLPGVLMSAVGGPFLGLILILAPLAVAYLMLCVAVPVAVMERPGVFASLGRSARLTAGSKGSIFLVFLVLWGLNWIAGKVIEAGMERVDSVWTILFAQYGLQVVIGTLQAVACAVIYHDLRVSKEGASVDELVKVFD